MFGPLRVSPAQTVLQNSTQNTIQNNTGQVAIGNNITQTQTCNSTEIAKQVAARLNLPEPVCKTNPTECNNNITYSIIQGQSALFVDQCDYVGTKIRDVTNTTITFAFQLSNNSSKNTRYILDIGESLEQNRLSVFYEDGLLKSRLSSDSLNDVTFKVPINEESPYGIGVSISQDYYEITVFDLTSRQLVADRIINATIPFRIVTGLMTFGSTIDGKSQMDGSINEVRLYQGTKSKDWIQATFLSTGTVAGPFEKVGSS